PELPRHQRRVRKSAERAGSGRHGADAVDTRRVRGDMQGIADDGRGVGTGARRWADGAEQDADRARSRGIERTGGGEGGEMRVNRARECAVAMLATMNRYCRLYGRD